MHRQTNINHSETKDYKDDLEEILQERPHEYFYDKKTNQSGFTTCDIREDFIENGCRIRKESIFPATCELTNRINNNSYVFVTSKSELFYIRNGIPEKINLQHLDEFKHRFKFLMEDENYKYTQKYLNNEQIDWLITSNSGHKPTLEPPLQQNKILSTVSPPKFMKDFFEEGPNKENNKENNIRNQNKLYNTKNKQYYINIAEDYLNYLAERIYKSVVPFITLGVPDAGFMQSNGIKYKEFLNELAYYNQSVEETRYILDSLCFTASGAYQEKIQLKESLCYTASGTYKGKIQLKESLADCGFLKMNEEPDIEKLKSKYQSPQFILANNKLFFSRNNFDFHY